MKIQVLIADDHPIVRAGIRSELSQYMNFEIVGEAVTGDQVIEMVRMTKVDVVILDINMSGMKTFEIIKQLRKNHPIIKILVLTACTDKGTVNGLLNAGVDGYISKDEEPNSIPGAIRLIVQGKNYLSPVISTLLVNEIKYPRKISDKGFLPDRELEILKLIAVGLTTREIANKLGIANRTVEFHVTRIYTRFGVNSRASAVNFAKDIGLF
ncbi:MAG: DNA-binding response regulator [Chloroflexi bacterium HGW-Chloroflexi-10]|nr:MAG: DNA-binding response regulator [Chloroflexi bacterium HGW-Chloroflexi-10]